MATFLVTLATGLQGTATIKHLLDAGAKVHAVVRNPDNERALALKSQGVVLFKAELNDFEGFRKAAEGCRGVFLNVISRPGLDSDTILAEGILNSCKKAGVESVVVSTATWAGDKAKWDNEPNRKSGLAAWYAANAGVEDVVRRAGFASYTILRPAWFHSNYLAPQSHQIYPGLADKGEFVHSLGPGVRMPHIDEDDIGRYASLALLDPKAFNSQEIELASENLTAEETGEIINRVSGKHIVIHRRTAEEQAAAGASPSHFIQSGANHGDLAVGPEIRQKYAFRLTPFEEYLQKHKDVLIASLPAQ